MFTEEIIENICLFLFVLKLVVSLVLTSVGGITRTFLLLPRVLIIDQYDFDEVVGSLSLLAIHS